MERSNSKIVIRTKILENEKHNEYDKKYIPDNELDLFYKADEASRNNSFNIHLHRISLIVLWTFSTVVVLTDFVLVWHWIGPEELYFANPDNLEKARAFIAGVVLSRPLTKYVEKKLIN